MDLLFEKSNLIQWLNQLDDENIIRQLKTFKNSLPNEGTHKISADEKAAIKKGLQSLAEGKVLTDEAVMRSIKEKFPHLFK